LSGCKVALKQGWYTYRHDNILAGIVKCLQDFLAPYSPSLPSEDDTINFVKASGKCSSVPKSIIGILHKADDWRLCFDSEDQNLVEPEPNINIVPPVTKRVFPENSSNSIPSGGTTTPSRASCSGHQTVTSNICGLVNKGNTCYANSLIQFLNALSKFCNLLSSSFDERNRLANSLAKFFFTNCHRQNLRCNNKIRQ